MVDLLNADADPEEKGPRPYRPEEIKALIVTLAKNNEVWLTRFDENAAKNIFRSIDVVIRRMNADQPYSPTTPQKLSFDLLVIETPAVAPAETDEADYTATTHRRESTKRSTVSRDGFRR